MRAADGVEGGVDAGPARARRGEAAHRRDEVAGAIVDRRRAVSLDHGQVGGRAGADRLQAEMAGEIEQRRADGPGRADHENGSARGQAPAAGEHLECGEIGERNAHRFRGVDPVGHGDEKTNGADRILRVAADDREIGDPYALARRSHARPGFVDGPDEIVAGGERQRPLEIGIAAHADEGVGEARAGGQHLDADLARAGLGKDRFFDELQDLGPAESINANAPPGHEPPSSL